MPNPTIDAIAVNWTAISSKHTEGFLIKRCESRPFVRAVVPIFMAHNIEYGFPSVCYTVEIATECQTHVLWARSIWKFTYYIHIMHSPVRYTSQRKHESTSSFPPRDFMRIL